MRISVASPPTNKARLCLIAFDHSDLGLFKTVQYDLNPSDAALQNSGISYKVLSLPFILTI